MVNRIKKYSIPASLIFVGTIFQCLTVFRSGLWYDFGMGFWGPTGRDLIWHLSLVEQIIKHIPPQNPGLAGEMLTNYHFYYDLVIAFIHKLTGVSVLDLIFRIFPVIFSVLYGIGTYLLAKSIFKDKLTAYLILFFTYFAGSFGWIVEWIKFGKLGGESAFWMNQPVSMNLNPPFAISMIFVIGIILMWNRYFKKPSFRPLCILVVLTYILFYFKSYAGLIMLFSFLYSFIYMLIYEKRYIHSFYNIFLFVLIFILFYGLRSNGYNFFEWQPFWLVNSAISFSDRVGWVKLSSAITNYLLGKNYLRLILAEGLALTIFIIGNFGMRVIGISVIFHKKIIKNPLIQLLLFLSIVSLVPSLLFVQKGTPWNSIQFSYYSLYFVSYFAGFTLAMFIKKNKQNYYFLPLILGISVISSVTTFTFGWYKKPPAELTRGEYEALNYLKYQPDRVVLIYPYRESFKNIIDQNPYPLSIYASTDYVAAFSGKATYLGDIEQQKILQTNYQKRLDFDPDSPEIDYVYLPKIYGINLDKSQYIKNLETIFENNDALIYKSTKRD